MLNIVKVVLINVGIKIELIILSFNILLIEDIV